MAMTTYSSSPYKVSQDGGAHHPRDASFSSYLDSSERDFVRNLAESVHHNNNHHQSPVRDSSSATPRPMLGKKNNRYVRSSELGVFGAERYFSEKLIIDHQKCPIPRQNCGGVRRKNKYRTERTVDLLEKKSITSSRSVASSTTTTASSLKSVTPSFKSESSWNSSQFGSKILNGLQCKGTCFNNKSVHTINTHENNSKVVVVRQTPKLHKGDNNKCSKVSHQEHFAFPIMHSPYNHLEEDQPRKSLEIFGFQHTGKQEDGVAQNLERKLSVLAWDAIPDSQSNGSLFPFPLPFPGAKKITNQSTMMIAKSDEEHDAGSEASSDLFEIENLAGINASQMSSYATSEASIEWSVVTASAADFSVDSEYLADHKTTCKKKMAAATAMDNKKISKVQLKKSATLGGGFLGCRTHKSVDVVRSFNNNTSNNNTNTKKF